jgi:hypothetical protein
MARRVTLRYLLTKLAGATEEFFAELSHQPAVAAAASASGGASSGAPAAAAASAAAAAAPGSLAAAASRFLATYRAASTTSVLLAGAAMAPALNAPAAAGDPRALEALVVRLLPRPSPRSVSVGDVVAFRAPPPATASASAAGDADADASSSSSSSSADSTAPAAAEHVLVRRVAALEQTEMVSDEAGDEPFRVPPGHCWVLADNGGAGAGEAEAAASAADDDGDDDRDGDGEGGPASAPPPPSAPRDSRAFGFVPLGSVLGRVVYSVRSAGEHGPVANAPSSAAGDAAVAEAEVDVDALARLVRSARERWDDAVSEREREASGGGGGAGSGAAEGGDARRAGGGSA